MPVQMVTGPLIEVGVVGTSETVTVTSLQSDGVHPVLSVRAWYVVVTFGDTTTVPPVANGTEPGPGVWSYQYNWIPAPAT